MNISGIKRIYVRRDLMLLSSVLPRGVEEFALMSVPYSMIPPRSSLTIYGYSFHRISVSHVVFATSDDIRLDVAASNGQQRIEFTHISPLGFPPFSSLLVTIMNSFQRHRSGFL